MFKRKYWLVIGIYIIMQALTAVVPLILNILYGYDFITSAIYLNVILFIIGVIAILWIMRQDIAEEKLQNPLSAGKVIGWAALGLVLAWGAEIIVASIQMYVFGIDQGSANSEIIVEISRMNPIFILVPAIVGPILEEIIFRKIIFGYLNGKFNFIIAALVSSFIFAAAHMEFTIILIYAAMGFVFAYLYMKTKRIIVPILVHIMINSFAVIGQLVIDTDKLQQMQDELMLIFFGL